MSNLDNTYSIIPSSGEFGVDWPVNFNLPQGASGGISTGGWTADNLDEANFGNEGFIQQTFLGASIVDFDLNAGFGDSPSTMTINLVNDEFNQSDSTPIGMGDDPYHNGISDTFSPPVVGTPVFFKFGKNPATVEQAFRQTFDDLYGIQTMPPKQMSKNPWGYPFPEEDWNPEKFDKLEAYHLVDRISKRIQDRSALWNIDTDWRGRNHFNFGGILQSYVQNKGNGGAPTYSVQLTDPREILSNVTILLNNYQGTTFNNKNLINVYGFLEYDPSEGLLSDFQNRKQMAGIVTKLVYANGNVDYIGVQAQWSPVTGWEKTSSVANQIISSKSWSSKGLTANIPSRIVNLQDQYYFGDQGKTNPANPPEFFPITGQGFSRRSDKGIPFYRVSQGLAAMFQYYGFLPQEYIKAGFGGVINFRGYNYVVDFSGIPTDKIPLLYYMDFDQIDLLSFAQELCDIISHELYVTLLPVIDHPACEFLFNYNNYQVENNSKENIIAGIIRLDAIDKTKQPKYGAIKSYLDELESRGINVENQDVGYELSNVTTDKFVVGAQEVETYFFSTERDRDTLWTWNQANSLDNRQWLQQYQWHLITQEQQQVLPYYGLLGNKAISIPRGFGSYQQILLDATALNAYGVGNYYVATELELRAALISYEKWKDFLLSYNDVYIEDISEHKAFIAAFSSENEQAKRVFSNFEDVARVNQLPDGKGKSIIKDTLDSLKNREYAVTVPRCVWHSDKPYLGENGYPASPCSPPFGYPLYYRRATSIGITEAGILNIVNSKTRLIKDTADLQKSFENINSPLLKLPKTTIHQNLIKIKDEIKKLSEENKDDPNFKINNQRYKALVQQCNEYSQVHANYEEMIENVKQAAESIATVTNMDNGPLGKFLFNIEKTARKHEENAKKVYDFVKSIAEECLGKKFLVRLPKSCNLGYSPTISTFGGITPFNIKNGPFGFPPKPISATPNPLLEDQELQFRLTTLNSVLNTELNLWNHYLQDYTSDKETDPAIQNRRSLSQTYSFGALKGNFNPFSEDWEWNYKPEPQGGFFGFNLFGVNISALQALKLGVPWDKMPPAIQQGLCPLDMTNLLSDSHRVQCYVRYNHSELLDFTGVNPNDIVQQSMSKGGQFIPDIVQELPNNNLNQKDRFEAAVNELPLPPSIAFVKCSVEEKLYMPPKLKKYDLLQYGREYKFTLSIPQPTVVEDIDPQTGCKVPRTIYPQITPTFSVPTSGIHAGGVDGVYSSWIDFDRVYDSETNSYIINTDIESLDDEHVYALITVPGRIKSLVDTRWNDGQNQAFQALQLKHLMTQDTVQISEFNKPNIPVADRQSFKSCGNPPVFPLSDPLALNKVIEISKKYGFNSYTPVTGMFGLKKNESGFIPGTINDWLTLSLEDITSARSVAKSVIQSSISNNPNIRINYTQPSPVYPDIVALPLMSMERCYGPWLSASQLNPEADPRIRYSDIGGKVEFIKDENLAPWNYAGYQLMNEAGSLQAQFSNSLLLFSERGGFSFPDAPTGVALAKALKQEGPLVTSISVNVSQGGIKTTVKLDLYTAQWGKLAKQKEMAISQIARERQKLRDEQNSAIRRGLGKRATSADLVNTVMNAGGRQVLNLVNSVATQLETNRELGKKISESITVVGLDGATTYSDSADLPRVLSTSDSNNFEKETTKNAIVSASQTYQAYSTAPNQALPSQEIDTSRVTQYITNPENTNYTLGQ